MALPDNCWRHPEHYYQCRPEGDCPPSDGSDPGAWNCSVKNSNSSAAGHNQESNEDSQPCAVNWGVKCGDENGITIPCCSGTCFMAKEGWAGCVPEMFTNCTYGLEDSYSCEEVCEGGLCKDVSTAAVEDVTAAPHTSAEDGTPAPDDDFGAASGSGSYAGSTAVPPCVASPGCSGQCAHVHDGTCVALAPCMGACPGAVAAENAGIPCDGSLCYCPTSTEYCGPAIVMTTSEIETPPESTDTPETSPEPSPITNLLEYPVVDFEITDDSGHACAMRNHLHVYLEEKVQMLLDGVSSPYTELEITGITVSYRSSCGTRNMVRSHAKARAGPGARRSEDDATEVSFTATITYDGEVPQADQDALDIYFLGAPQTQPPEPEHGCLQDEPLAEYANCTGQHSGCCGDGLYCYVLDSSFAQCRQPGTCPDCSWSCEVLPAPCGAEEPQLVQYSDCRTTQCCPAGTSCYQQDDGLAMCLPDGACPTSSCAPSGPSWTCQVLVPGLKWSGAPARRSARLNRSENLKTGPAAGGDEGLEVNMRSKETPAGAQHENEGGAQGAASREASGAMMVTGISVGAVAFVATALVLLKQRTASERADREREASRMLQGSVPEESKRQASLECASA